MTTAKKSMTKLCDLLNQRSKAWLDLIDELGKELPETTRSAIKEAYLLISDVREIKEKFEEKEAKKQALRDLLNGGEG